jgi:hypothetical protein
MAKEKRTIVGSPLTPEMLFQLGAIPGFSPNENPLDPAGKWTNRYRVWTCHGYRESGNLDVGFLQIQRGPADSNKRFELQVYQELKNEGGTFNRVVAKIDCIEGDLSYPVNWDYTSIFLAADGKEDKPLTVNVQGQSFDSEIRWTRNGVVSKLSCKGRPSCDWCVYETVQRRAKQFTSSLTFDMLEGLERLKPAQQLIDRGGVNVKIGNSDRRLHRFDQIGTGVLPFEYWVDESLRLCLMVSMNKVYILDTENGQKENTDTQRKGFK